MDIPETEGASDADMARVEQELACKFPAAWRQFIRSHDGARPAENTFDLPYGQANVRTFVPIRDAAALRIQIDGFPSHGVPIADDSCGNYVWLDPASGEIFFWDHELEEEASARLAPDLTGFLASLKPFDASSVRLRPDQVKGVWINPELLGKIRGR